MKISLNNKQASQMAAINRKAVLLARNDTTRVHNGMARFHNSVLIAMEIIGLTHSQDISCWWL